MRMGAIQEQGRAVREALADTTRAIEQERRRRKEATKRAARAWQLTEVLRRPVLILYLLADYNAAAAVRYLAKGGKRRHWPPKSDEELAAVVEECFLHADADELAALADTAHPLDVAAMKAAQGYLEEWRLVTWTASLNSAKGLAPTNEMVLQRAEESRLRLPEALRFESHGAINENRARKWVRRWRLRWGGRLATPRVLEPLTLDEMRAKAIDAWGVARWVCDGRAEAEMGHACTLRMAFNGDASMAMYGHTNMHSKNSFHCTKHGT